MTTRRRTAPDNPDKPDKTEQEHNKTDNPGPRRNPVTPDDPLEQFEALVQRQVPAAAPWQPVTDYTFEARRVIEGEHPRLIAEMFQPRRVLDYGCGPGHLVALLRTQGVEASGYEPSDAQRDLETLIARPVIQRGLPRLKRQYDLVICREVLEHVTLLTLTDIVTHLCQLSSRYVYITTRFAQHPTHWLDVETSDDLDPTHITMVTKDFLRLLLILEGFIRRADLEAQLDHQHQGRVLVYERP